MKLKRLCILLFVVNTSFSLSFAQQNSDLIVMRRALKTKILEAELKNNDAIDSVKLLDMKAPNIANAKVTLMRIDKNFGPIYYQTHNLKAAETNRTNSVQPGGLLGLNLEGENLAVGVWDAGVAFEGHQEFKENNVSRIIIGEEGKDPDDHATHVAGTIIANGTYAEAKGMAPKAKVITYDWNNVRAEELSEVEDGLLLSNHSYGPAGFEDNGDLAVSADYFGTYDDTCAYLDEILYLYPNYLHVTSAGNNGQQTYSGGMASDYDKLLGEKNAKNNLVVANGNDISYITPTFYLLNINPSSSQGPTNDLRIKPDITGNGSGLISPIFTTSLSYDDYGNYTGTSMASPSVAGSILLLQEHYYNLNQKYMRSATLKGLVCHTAYDIEEPGPDPDSGWGYIDIKTAAEYITNGSNIYETTLSNNGIIDFDVSGNGSTLKVTICWTDPAGNQQTGPDYNQPVLVNDLNVKITQNGNSYYPWKFYDGGVYSSDGWATKGVNSVDNIEIIEIENASGVFNVEISHLGTLYNNEQKFSIILSENTALTLSGNQIKNISKDELIVLNSTSKKELIVKSISNTPLEYYKVFDINGRILMHEKINNLSTFKLNTTGINSGIYFILAGNSEKTFSVKTIIF